MSESTNETTMCLIGEHASGLTLFPGLGNSVPIVRVDDEDDTLGVLEVYIVRTQDTKRMSDSSSIFAFDVQVEGGTATDSVATKA
jgi:hypothetical protein